MPSEQGGKGRLDACEDIQHSISSIIKLRDYLTLDEEIHIHRQFRNSTWKPDSQVLWSGMLRENAQEWTDHHHMQTLTTAMGPLMDPGASTCLQRRKSGKAWSKYIHGASAIFAWHIAQSNRVTVLCPPPPQRFHPSGLSYFQTIEEPILRAAINQGTPLMIQLVHPGVAGATDFCYQLFPQDETETWISAFGTGLCYKCAWRTVKGDRPASKKTITQTQMSSPKMRKQKAKIAAPSTVGAPPIKPKMAPKKSKKKKKKKKSISTCSPHPSTPNPLTSKTSPKGKVAGKNMEPAPAKKTPATNPTTVLAGSQLTKKQRKALETSPKNSPKLEPKKSKAAMKRARKKLRAAAKKKTLTQQNRAAKPAKTQEIAIHVET